MYIDNDEFPVVKFVDYVLEYAVYKRASDVHFETFSQNMKVRLRIDGVLVELPAPDGSLGEPVISRIKTLANLDLAEKRLPQDGHIERKYFGRLVDFRVSTLPTQYGESVVLRILDKGNWHFDLNKMGISEKILSEFRKALNSGSGIILTTGPTGSGKTTTLYSALAEINNEETKIVTVEDPVEYETEGIVQVNVHDEVGLTFESALRSFLRHDPDKILVGELRDTTTAQVAIQAALTGHLVLGTLHTNDAPSAVTRLIDMGLDAYLIADTVKGIIAQRLVRKICDKCKVQQDITHECAELCESLNISKLYIGTGCKACNNTGYSGRIGIYEWMQVTFNIRQAIRKKVPLEELHKIALKEGLIPLKEVALNLVKSGITSLHEFMKI